MKLLALCVVVLYFLMPIAIVGSETLPDAIFYALMAACIGLLFQEKWANTRAVLAQYKVLLLCYCVPLLAVVISMLAHMHWANTDFRRAVSLSLGLPVLLLALPHVKRIPLAQCLWGIYIAALGATAYVAQLAYADDFNRPHTEIYNMVSYSNLMILLAVVSLFSIGWQLTSSPRLERAVKIIVTALTLIGFVLTQTRTGWLAVPLFVLIGVALVTGFKRPLRSMGMLLGIIAVALAFGLSSDGLRGRVKEGVKQTLTCHGERSTSNNNVCARIQLWHAAWQMFQEKPLVGLGDGELFPQKLKTESLPEGIVSRRVVRYLIDPHNDMLYSLASFGVLGGLGLLLTYLAPAVVFARRLHSRYPLRNRSAAAMGMAFCLGFIFLGLTEFMFHQVRTASFYVMFVGLFLVLSQAGESAAQTSES